MRWWQGLQGPEKVIKDMWTQENPAKFFHEGTQSTAFPNSPRTCGSWNRTSVPTVRTSTFSVSQMSRLKDPLVPIRVTVHGNRTRVLEVHRQIPALLRKQWGCLSVLRGASSVSSGPEVSYPHTTPPRETPGSQQIPVPDPLLLKQTIGNTNDIQSPIDHQSI